MEIVAQEMTTVYGIVQQQIRNQKRGIHQNIVRFLHHGTTVVIPVVCRNICFSHRTGGLSFFGKLTQPTNAVGTGDTFARLRLDLDRRVDDAKISATRINVFEGQFGFLRLAMDRKGGNAVRNTPNVQIVNIGNARNVFNGIKDTLPVHRRGDFLQQDGHRTAEHTDGTVSHNGAKQ
eukprot:scaffold8005_cov275-Amphora_coffeaeformis.AAC.4